MSVSLKIIQSVPTPGCSTSSRTFVDSIPDAGKTEGSWHARGENGGRISHSQPPDFIEGVLLVFEDLI